ncbi:velvet factor-domain-containing protein [Phlyctochytrium arcticum]|nr:velvet factor-domain-containing protein [Phlyctochytrium arcticum]
MDGFYLGTSPDLVVTAWNGSTPYSQQDPSQHHPEQQHHHHQHRFDRPHHPHSHHPYIQQQHPQHQQQQYDLAALVASSAAAAVATSMANTLTPTSLAMLIPPKSSSSFDLAQAAVSGTLSKSTSSMASSHHPMDQLAAAAAAANGAGLEMGEENVLNSLQMSMDPIYTTALGVSRSLPASAQLTPSIPDPYNPTAYAHSYHSQRRASLSLHEEHLRRQHLQQPPFTFTGLTAESLAANNATSAAAAAAAARRRNSHDATYGLMPAWMTAESMQQHHPHLPTHSNSYPPLSHHTYPSNSNPPPLNFFPQPQLTSIPNRRPSRPDLPPIIPNASSPATTLPTTRHSASNESSHETTPQTSRSGSKFPCYELLIRQEPIRARMSGFNNKDRRPIDPPPIIELLERDEDGNLTEVSYTDASLLVLHASLCTADTMVEAFPRNPVPPQPPAAQHQTSLPSPSSLGRDPPPLQNQLEAALDAVSAGLTISTKREPDTSIFGTSANPTFRVGTTAGMSTPFDTSSDLPPPPSSTTLQQQPPTPPTTTTTPTPPRTTTTSTTHPVPPSADVLLGSLVSACHMLRDLEGRKGLFFVLQDVGVRTSGMYRLRFDLYSVADAIMPQTYSTSSSPSSNSPTDRFPLKFNTPSGRLTCSPPSSPPTPPPKHVSPPWTGSIASGPPRQSQATVFTNVFRVYSPKTFPGMSDSTPLSKCFARQGIRIHIRTDTRGKGHGRHATSLAANRLSIKPKPIPIPPPTIVVAIAADGPDPLPADLEDDNEEEGDMEVDGVGEDED